MKKPLRILIITLFAGLGIFTLLYDPKSFVKGIVICGIMGLWKMGRKKSSKETKD